jgi:signal transduction histidine kinase
MNNQLNELDEVLLARQPATSRQRGAALFVAVILLGALGALAPFSTIPLQQSPAFVTSLEFTIFVIDLITSVLLFVQFSIYRSRALLALASGYLFTALVVIPHALSFPGAFIQSGLAAGGLQSTAWLFIAWHTGFSMTLLGYALLRGGERTNVQHVSAAIGWSVAIVITLVCGVTWVAVVGDKLLPHFYLDNLHPGWLVRYISTSILLVRAIALALLWTRRRSVLDEWLVVVACAALAQPAFTALLGAHRFSLGFYAGRTFSLVTSAILLVVLLVEMTRLYERLAHSNAMLRRERNSKLMNLDALVASISHEVRQPLSAIAMNGEAALEFLNLSPPDIEEVRSALTAIVDDSHRTNDIFTSIRALFTQSNAKKKLIDINEVILGGLRMLQKELKHYGVETNVELNSELPRIMGHETQLQEVLINLVQNAIEAMAINTDRSRVLRIRTEAHGSDEIAVSVEDSGSGIDREKAGSIFDTFVTTKAGGMGLGLAICRIIIERHEGRISASSNTKGGATFQFILPIKTAIGSMAPPL